MKKLLEDFVGYKIDNYYKVYTNNPLTTTYVVSREDSKDKKSFVLEELLVFIYNKK